VGDIPYLLPVICYHYDVPSEGLPTVPRSALAALCRDVGTALVRFGRTLDATVAVAPGTQGPLASTAPAEATAPSAVIATGAAPETSRKLGQRQQALLALPGLREDLGLSSAEVAIQLEIAIPNAHAALTGLAGRNLVERIGDDKPVRWRLVDRGQPTSTPAKTSRRVPAAILIDGDIPISSRKMAVQRSK
jgi:hypothetical protein